jgi:hypothetical protein
MMEMDNIVLDPYRMDVNELKTEKRKRKLPSNPKTRWMIHP